MATAPRGQPPGVSAATMADGSPRPPLYRSVSFKLLERWSGGPGPKEEDTDAVGLRRRASCRPAAAAPGQPSRRVSKLASGPPAAPAQPRPLRSLSPSVRQLSRRFDAPRPDCDSAGARDGGVSPGRGRSGRRRRARGLAQRHRDAQALRRPRVQAAQHGLGGLGDAHPRRRRVGALNSGAPAAADATSSDVLPAGGPACGAAAGTRFRD